MEAELKENMEILGAGAFINLENQEKIEQLKSTAIQLANAALETDEFTNDEESGKRLALEFWQGLEYMCRESEEAAIKNIFLGHFLDRLSQFRPTQPATIDSPQDSALENEAVPVDDETNPEDEFLGVIDTAESEETTTQETQAVTQESSAHSQDFLTLEKDSFQEVGVKTTENVSTETASETASSAEIEEKVESEKDVPREAKRSIGNLSLPDKEPYQFGKCTVTATIQLLPAGDDGAISRKVVLSVRTHDFAPQISLVELAGNNLTAEIAPELEKVLAKYQSDLPAKVMDKLKKEKTAAKKTAPKSTSEVKTASQETTKPKESVNSQTAPPPAANQSDTPSIPPAAQTGQQGSLFGI